MFGKILTLKPLINPIYRMINGSNTASMGSISNIIKNNDSVANSILLKLTAIKTKVNSDEII
jgi:hypothetical protein